MSKELIRCPRLGHEVNFAYCRKEGGIHPCERIFSCWGGFMPVEEILKKEMGEEEWSRFVKGAGREKISTLVELIEQARIRKKL